jgi:hypothetical protein
VGKGEWLRVVRRDAKRTRSRYSRPSSRSVLSSVASTTEGLCDVFHSLLVTNRDDLGTPEAAMASPIGPWFWRKGERVRVLVGSRELETDYLIYLGKVEITVADLEGGDDGLTDLVCRCLPRTKPDCLEQNQQGRLEHKRHKSAPASNMWPSLSCKAKVDGQPDVPKDGRRGRTSTFRDFGNSRGLDGAEGRRRGKVREASEENSGSRTAGFSIPFRFRSGR